MFWMFVTGLFIGSLAGFLTMALLCMAGASDAERR